MRTRIVPLSSTLRAATARDLTAETAERAVRWWLPILLLTLLATVMSGCDWRHPDPREPVIAPATNDAEAMSNPTSRSDPSREGLGDDASNSRQ